MAHDDHDPAPARDRWLGLELRHLVALAAVAREGSFSAAAARLGHVQSAVSQQISSLERLAGTRLVERTRGPGPLTLTSAGVLLLEHAEGIFAELRLARSDLVAKQRPGGTKLVLGTHSETSLAIAARLLARVHDIAVLVREAGSETELLSELEAGELDLALAELPVEPPPFAHEPLVREPYVLIAPEGASVTRCSRAQLPEEVAALPLIGERSSRATASLDAELATFGLEARWVVRTDVHGTVVSLVRAGVGCGLVPRLAAHALPSGLVAVELAGLVEPQTIALFWLEGCALERRLRDEIRAASGKLAQLAGEVDEAP